MFSPRVLRLTLSGTLSWTSPCVGQLLTNGDFEQGPAGWTLSGDWSMVTGGYENSTSLLLDPTPAVTAQASQVLTGLAPQDRYTVAVLMHTTHWQVPPIIGVRGGVQIEKARAYVDLEDQGLWIEQRFEFYTTNEGEPVELYLQAWKTGLEGTVMIDNVSVVQGRQPMPDPQPGQAPFRTPPPIVTQPEQGDALILNGDFADETAAPWALGLNAEVVVRDGAPAMQLTSTADTSRASQPLGVALAPSTTYTIAAEAKVDAGVVASMYVTGPSGESWSVPIDSTGWEEIELSWTTPEFFLAGGQLTLENWKNQPGRAWFRNVRLMATGGEWSPTTDAIPTPQDHVFFDDFSSGALDPHRWLVSTKGWGGDNGGVAPANVSIVDDIDDGTPIKALRLAANGDLYQGDVIHNGRSTRVGAAIATRQYFASGRYTVRAKVAPELGTCTAFWPFHYIDYHPSQQGYWHDPNPRRNTEIDWEFPTDLWGQEDHGDDWGIDPEAIAFTNARTNSWGGQFGGEGGEHKGRRVLRDSDGTVLDLAAEARDGRYHDFTIQWRSGVDAGDEGMNRTTVGSVEWFLDGILIDELSDVEFGQGNVPFRAARFWLGTWFPAAGYGDHVGWTGNPDFDSTAALIASVKIEPLTQARDAWESETVPNLAWATPDQYPAGAPLCLGDLDGDGRVGIVDLLEVLNAWGLCPGCPADLDGDGAVGVADLLVTLDAWGDC